MPRKTRKAGQVRNPLTNRFVKIGGPKYKELVRDGVIGAIGAAKPRRRMAERAERAAPSKSARVAYADHWTPRTKAMGGVTVGQYLQQNLKGYTPGLVAGLVGAHDVLQRSGHVRLVQKRRGSRWHVAVEYMLALGPRPQRRQLGGAGLGAVAGVASSLSNVSWMGQRGTDLYSGLLQTISTFVGSPAEFQCLATAAMVSAGGIATSIRGGGSALPVCQKTFLRSMRDKCGLDTIGDFFEIYAAIMDTTGAERNTVKEQLLVGTLKFSNMYAKLTGLPEPAGTAIRAILGPAVNDDESLAKLIARQARRGAKVVAAYKKRKEEDKTPLAVPIPDVLQKVFQVCVRYYTSMMDRFRATFIGKATSKITAKSLSAVFDKFTKFADKATGSLETLKETLDYLDSLGDDFTVYECCLDFLEVRAPDPRFRLDKQMCPNTMYPCMLAENRRARGINRIVYKTQLNNRFGAFRDLFEKHLRIDRSGVPKWLIKAPTGSTGPIRELRGRCYDPFLVKPSPLCQDGGIPSRGCTSDARFPCVENLVAPRRTQRGGAGDGFTPLKRFTTTRRRDEGGWTPLPMNPAMLENPLGNPFLQTGPKAKKGTKPSNSFARQSRRKSNPFGGTAQVPPAEVFSGTAQVPPAEVFSGTAQVPPADIEVASNSTSTTPPGEGEGFIESRFSGPVGRRVPKFASSLFADGSAEASARRKQRGKEMLKDLDMIRRTDPGMAHMSDDEIRAAVEKWMNAAPRPSQSNFCRGLKAGSAQDHTPTRGVAGVLSRCINQFVVRSVQVGGADISNPRQLAMLNMASFKIVQSILILATSPALAPAKAAMAAASAATGVARRARSAAAMAKRMGARLTPTFVQANVTRVTEQFSSVAKYLADKIVDKVSGAVDGEEEGGLGQAVGAVSAELLLPGEPPNLETGPAGGDLTSIAFQVRNAHLLSKWFLTELVRIMDGLEAAGRPGETDMRDAPLKAYASGGMYALVNSLRYNTLSMLSPYVKTAARIVNESAEAEDPEDVSVYTGYQMECIQALEGRRRTTAEYTSAYDACMRRKETVARKPGTAEDVNQELRRKYEEDLNEMPALPDWIDSDDDE